MKNTITCLIASFALLLPLVGVFGLVSSSPAHAASIHENLSPLQPSIDRTGCHRGYYFEIHNNTGTLCFANAGTMDVMIDHVALIRSGNNAAFVLDSGGSQYTLPKYTRINFASPVTVTRISIS